MQLPCPTNTPASLLFPDQQRQLAFPKEFRRSSRRRLSVRPLLVCRNEAGGPGRSKTAALYTYLNAPAFLFSDQPPRRADKQKAAEMKSLVRLLLLLSGAFAVIPAESVKSNGAHRLAFFMRRSRWYGAQKTLHDKRRASINPYRIDCHASTKASYIRTATARHWKKFRETSPSPI